MAREAAFGPVVPEVLPPDYGARSQGIRFTANTGLADAFGDLAKIGGQAIVATDQAIQQGIRREAEKGFDEVSASFGVEDATTLAQVDVTPQAVRNGQRRINGLQAQFEAGVINERHYYASLNTIVRQLRSKYPGYREQIDNIIADVTGVRPANQVQAALFAEAEASQKEMTKQEKRIQEIADRGNLPPNYYDVKGTADEWTAEELEKYNADRERSQADVQAANAALTYRKATGDVTEDEALGTFSKNANTFIYSNLRNASSVMGKSFAALNAKIEKASTSAGAGEFNSPELKAEISAGLNELIRTTKMSLMEEATRPDGPYSGILKDRTKLDSAIEIAMSPIYNLVEAFGGEKADLSLLKSTAALIEANTDASTAEMLKSVDGARELAALTKLVGAENASLYLNSDGGTALSAFVKSIKDYQTAKIQTDEAHNVLKALTEIDLTRGPDKEAAQRELLKHWPYLIDKAAKGELPPDVYKKNVRFMFAPQTLELMSTLDPADRTEYLKLVSSPTITRQMVVLKNEGDTESWEMYKNWVTTSFQAVFRDEVQELQQFQIDNLQMDVQFDATSKQFVLVPNADAPDRGPISNLGTQYRANRMRTNEQSALNKLNTQLQVIAPIIEEEGLDTAAEISQLLQSMGYDKDIEQTGMLGDQLWEAVTAVTKQAVENAKGGPNKKPIWEAGSVSRRYRTPNERNQTKVKVLEETKVNPE
jgi:hypothetical protein